MDITNSPKNLSASQRIPIYNQESIFKYFSNRTITDSKEDQLSFRYFNQDPNENNNMDVECEKNDNCTDAVKAEYAYPILNKNEITHSNLIDDNLENIASTNDPNLNYCDIKTCNEKRAKKQNLDNNSDNESCSSREILGKTNAEIVSNESINEKNKKLNIDLNLNLNENDNLSLTNVDLNNNIKNTNLNESLRLEDEKSNNTNTKNKSTIANRKRGRQRKNIKNKKYELKAKDDSSNPAKPASEYISTISRKLFSENAWVHLSCALWIPEVLIEEFEKKENIKST